MGLITLVLYIGVLLLWVYFLYRMFIVRSGNPNDRRQLLLLTALVVLLTAMRLYS